VVKAAPPGNIIQRNVEQVAAFQRCQHSLAIFFPIEGSALNTAQPVEY
jgi:hypothetical protein